MLQCGKEKSLFALQELVWDDPHSASQLVERAQKVDQFPCVEVPALQGATLPSPLTDDRVRWPSPWIVTLFILVKDRVKQDFRGKYEIISILAVYTVQYLLVSFVHFQMPKNLDLFTEKVGLFDLLVVNLLFSNALTMNVTFDRTEIRIVHERRLGLVQSFSVVLSRFLAALPVRIITLTVWTVALYYIVGLRTDGFQYVVVFVGDLTLVALLSIALGILVSTLTIKLDYGQVLICLAGVFFEIFGNFSTAPKATWILRWMQYVSPFFYSLQCLVQNQVDDTDFVETRVGSQILADSGFDQISITASLGALAGFAILYLVLAIIIYDFRHPKLIVRYR